MLGIVGAEKRETLKFITEAAEKATRCLWIKTTGLLEVAEGTLAKVYSAPAGSPGQGNLMLKS